MSYVQFTEFLEQEATVAYWNYLPTVSRKRKPMTFEEFKEIWSREYAVPLRKQWNAMIRLEILSTPKAILLSKFDRSILERNNIDVDLIIKERSRNYYE